MYPRYQRMLSHLQYKWRDNSECFVSDTNGSDLPTRDPSARILEELNVRQEPILHAPITTSQWQTALRGRRRKKKRSTSPARLRCRRICAATVLPGPLQSLHMNSELALTIWLLVYTRHPQLWAISGWRVVCSTMGSRFASSRN